MSQILDPIFLQVGKIYQTRDGDLVQIIHRFSPGHKDYFKEHPFGADNGVLYTPYGTCGLHDINEDDIIRETEFDGVTYLRHIAYAKLDDWNLPYPENDNE